jgi:LuxR family maltose regulon positive regulatory protein
MVEVGSAQHPDSPGSVVRLTDREMEILQCLPTRLSVLEIGAYMNISPNTVKSHLRSIYSKLGVGSRNQAILEGSKRRLLAPQARFLVMH